MHYLISVNSEKPIATFLKFNPESFKNVIVEHLKSNPYDIVEHRKKEGSKRKFINLYSKNVNGKISKITM